MAVIDGDGLILGRLASIAAKRLLSGEQVHIVNAEKVVVSGSKRHTFEHYLKMRHMGFKEKGPYYPKRPDSIVKRTVRGMLPYKRARGRQALSNLRVYVGVPEELEHESRDVPEQARMERLSTRKYVRLGEVSEFLGSRF
ncbi:MAG: 50S ribosomal protein L13 [Methermicoccaceae archaeon]